MSGKMAVLQFRCLTAKLWHTSQLGISVTMFSFGNINKRIFFSNKQQPSPSLQRKEEANRSFCAVIVQCNKPVKSTYLLTSLSDSPISYLATPYHAAITTECLLHAIGGGDQKANKRSVRLDLGIH